MHTANGQITLPASIHKASELTEDNKAHFDPNGNKTTLGSVKDDITASFGLFKASAQGDTLSAIAQGTTHRYQKTLV